MSQFNCSVRHFIVSELAGHNNTRLSIGCIPRSTICHLSWQKANSDVVPGTLLFFEAQGAEV